MMLKRLDIVSDLPSYENDMWHYTSDGWTYIGCDFAYSDRTKILLHFIRILKDENYGLGV